MAFSTINKSSLYQNNVLYTGNTSDAHGITGVGFQPDFTWLKRRNTTGDHELYDAVRGATIRLETNTQDANATDTNSLQSFDTDGFTVGTRAMVNSANTFVSWNWKANGAGSLNEVGSIDSTVSVNTTSGFSIVKWTNSTSNAGTIGHGLGVAPQVILVKTTSTGTTNWHVYHHKLDSTPQQDYLILNDTSAKSTSTNIWNDTAPTSTVFSTGDNGALVNNTCIAYCFADVAGYSKISSYVGNGNADGTFVYTGFKPSFVMFKNASASGSNWQIYNNKIDGFNSQNDLFRANGTEAEAAVDPIDILSNGFKQYNTAASNNVSGQTYIYMAFGQPIISNGGVCATAR